MRARASMPTGIALGRTMGAGPASAESSMEARIAHLESDVGHLRTDVAEIKVDVRSLRDKMDMMMAKLSERIDNVLRKSTRREFGPSCCT